MYPNILKSRSLIWICLAYLIVNSSVCFAKKRKNKSAFQEGQTSLHFGLGYPSLMNTSKNDLKEYGELKSSYSPPMSFRAEYAVKANLALGLFLGYSNEKATITDVTNPENVNGFKMPFKIFGGVITYHQTIKSKIIDPYAAVMLGYSLVKPEAFGSHNYMDAAKNSFAYSIHTGLNYYVAPKFAIFGEIGYGFALINAGCTFKI
jgi:hypothetical protein